MSPVTELHEPDILEQIPQVPTSQSATAIAMEPPLFADVLLELDSTEKRWRGWAAVFSVILQSLVVGSLMVLPLMFTEALPTQQLLTFLVAPPPPPPPPPAAGPAPRVARRVESDLLDGSLRMPSRIPQKVEMIHEDQAPPLASGIGTIGGVVGGIPGGQLGGVIGGIISSTANMTMVPKLATPAIPKRIRISQGVTRGMLMKKIEPKYPAIAISARIQGLVVLSAFVSPAGQIENLQAISGHPMLVPAAIEAVKQWRYRPYLLNGVPMEVETTIMVTFKLQ
jgi:protein TonB